MMKQKSYTDKLKEQFNKSLKIINFCLLKTNYQWCKRSMTNPVHVYVLETNFLPSHPAIVQAASCLVKAHARSLPK
jgi:hypothetical protein